MNQGLLAFLGLVAAALVQVIPVTANFLQSDDLTPEEAIRLSRGLRTQQRYWLGLLASVIFAFVIVVIASVLKERTVVTIWHERTVDISSAASLIICASITFVVVKLTGLFAGVISLQILREELVINSAKRRAADRAEVAQRAVDLPAVITPEGYGRIIQPPH
ncbi:hypothetical protein [Caballeronia sordidicola]|uniref:hypothetical protein n=1 Tax=Caballeronia sordidicola TaxID=196367 RepID=UPI00117E33BF|nr:hypothetical protein [Caballeronia sordidicola]